MLYLRLFLKKFWTTLTQNPGRGKRSYLWFRKRICEKGKYDVQFEDLPEVCPILQFLLFRLVFEYKIKHANIIICFTLLQDVQCIVFSKLELKEAVRTSVLSSQWATHG
jgi:hypothetical protein